MGKISLKEAYHYLIFNIHLSESVAEEIILDRRLTITQVKGKVMVNENDLNKLIGEYDG